MGEVAKALISAVIGAAVTIGAAWFVWVNYQKPSLELAQEEARQAVAERDRERAARQASDRAIFEIREKWQTARYQFLARVNVAIADATKPRSAWEGRTPPQPEYLARQIVAERDALRAQVVAIRADLDAVSQNLNSDIDAIATLLDRLPVDQKRLLELLGRLNVSWPAKAKLIDAIAQRTILQLGCPQLMAANP